MKVIEYLLKNQIKYYPINLVDDHKTNKKIPVGSLNGYGSQYPEFKTISDKELQNRQRINKDFPLIALNTYEQIILDVDEIDVFEKSFPKLAKLLKKKCIYYKSRNKRLPHYIIKVKNLPANPKARYAPPGCDVLCGQWAWFKRDEKLIHKDRSIIEIDFNDIIKTKVEPIKTKKECSKPETANIDDKYIDIDRKSKTIKSLLKRLLPNRSSDFDDWRNIGFIINYELGKDGYDIYDEWSKQSKDKYDKNGVLTFWNSIKPTNTPLTIATLRSYANKDDPILFNFKNEFTDGYVAEYFLELYSHQFASKNGMYYYYNGNYWVTDTKKNSYLHCFIDKTYYDVLVSALHMYDRKNKDAGIEKFADKLDKYRKNVEKLRSISFRENMVKNIINALDYYITITTGYDYNENYDTKYIDTSKNLIKQIHPNENIRNTYLTGVSTGLEGVNVQKFIIFSGGGGNGKGLLNELAMKTFGNYAYKLPTSVLMQPLKLGSNPEIASMNCKRFVITQEPEKDQKNKGSVVKELTGGSEINARLNFSNDTKTKLHCTLILECNDKPLMDEVNDAIHRRLIDISFQSSFIK